MMLLASIGLSAHAGAGSLRVEVRPRFAGAPLRFDAMTNLTAAGQTVSVTRLDFLLSNPALRSTGGTWLGATNRFAYVHGRAGRTEFTLPGLPPGNYDRIRFQVGVPERENHTDPGGRAAGHPLNPNVNGLHWSWQGGYVFLALEGHWRQPDDSSAGEKVRGFSYHLATDRLLMTVELPLTLQFDGDRSLRLELDVDRIFSHPHRIRVTEDMASTHSRAGDALAGQLRENIEQAFSVDVAHNGARPELFALASFEEDPAAARWQHAEPGSLLVASNATPYRFTFPRSFPQPALPPDNPLTVEGVELGRRLFNETRLSINDRQSCASCHQANTGFIDAGQRFSLGAESRAGSRNAMPLFNLAWRSSFFWDGRASSLRAQVLQPIENPIEMHETLANVVAKLEQAGSRNESSVAGKVPRPERSPQCSTSPYPALFNAAFGTPEITSSRLARALEQFLLVQVSHHSRFDRSLAGETELTAEEQRGFDLFHTEYDPRRGQFGADCFHCHGGPLFQSQRFANNGLDPAGNDPGRHGVTKQEGDRGRFAVPSLRNVALTAPYMHDGRFATLEEVVVHYSDGVHRSVTLDPNLAKHPDGGLQLSPADQRALVAFLKTLTGE
jgi:cytochrome c peroxidase